MKKLIIALSIVSMSINAYATLVCDKVAEQFYNLASVRDLKYDKNSNISTRQTMTKSFDNAADTDTAPIYIKTQVKDTYHKIINLVFDHPELSPRELAARGKSVWCKDIVPQEYK